MNKGEALNYHCWTSFPVTLVPQVQFWHLVWFVYGESMGDLQSHMLCVLHLISRAKSTPIVETQPLDVLHDFAQKNVVLIRVH